MSDLPIYSTIAHDIARVARKANPRWRLLPASDRRQPYPKMRLASCTAVLQRGHVSSIGPHSAHAHRCPHGISAMTGSPLRQTTHSLLAVSRHSSANASCSAVWRSVILGLSFGALFQQFCIRTYTKSGQLSGCPSRSRRMTLLMRSACSTARPEVT